MASIKLFAGTDVGLRDNNEDNFIVCPDLTKDEWMVPANQQEPIQLGQRGCLVVVADGMGGMNAGEVASDIAIKTVQRLFAPAVLPADTVEKPEAVKAYLKKVIAEADQQVKTRCKDDPDTEGMGSTIVIAWLIKDMVYIGWLGDSRAYSFMSGGGEGTVLGGQTRAAAPTDMGTIIRLSKDHSYVQQLVDANILTEEEAMNHPESNVIVRSLGDTSQKARPDVTVHPVCNGEIILLCSDGLCGVCTDAEIAAIIGMHTDDLQLCKEALTTAALKAGGSDNITVALLQVDSVENGIANPQEQVSISLDESAHSSSNDCHVEKRDLLKGKLPIWLALCVAALCVAALFLFLPDNNSGNASTIEQNNGADTDTISNAIEIANHFERTTGSFERNKKNDSIHLDGKNILQKKDQNVNVNPLETLTAGPKQEQTSKKKDEVELKENEISITPSSAENPSITTNNNTKTISQ